MSWKKPPAGWFTLITDGSVLGSTRRVGCGGLIRNCEGDWIRGFARGSGSSNSCLAECWALRDGLNLAIELGIVNLIREIDALSIV